MSELTLEQQQAVARWMESPLSDAEDDEQFLLAMHPHVMKIFGEAGWDDPAMDVYNELDPRTESGKGMAAGNAGSQETRL